MSWLYSRALAAEFLADTCSDGAPSAQLSGNSTQQAYCAPDKMTAFSRLSRFGMTYAPLTVSRGEELLMSYRAGFHAKTSALPGGGQGITGERSGLWKEMARIVGEVRPRYVFVENSPMLTFRGLGTVLGDLAALGFDAEWGVLSAADVGAPHLRERIWILGYSDNDGQIAAEVSRSIAQGGNRCAPRTQQASEFARSSEQHAHVADSKIERCGEARRSDDGEHDRTISGAGGEYVGEISNAMRSRSQGGREVGEVARPTGLCGRERRYQEQHLCDTASARFSQRADEPLGRPEQIAELERPDWWAVEPDVGRVVNGMAARVDRLKAIGNGQVPAVVRKAWRILTHNM